jgi:hypothetical protein
MRREQSATNAGMGLGDDRLWTVKRRPCRRPTNESEVGPQKMFLTIKTIETFLARPAALLSLARNP